MPLDFLPPPPATKTQSGSVQQAAYSPAPYFRAGTDRLRIQESRAGPSAAHATAALRNSMKPAKQAAAAAGACSLRVRSPCVRRQSGSPEATDGRNASELLHQMPYSWPQPGPQGGCCWPACAQRAVLGPFRKHGNRGLAPRQKQKAQLQQLLTDYERPELLNQAVPAGGLPTTAKMRCRHRAWLVSVPQCPACSAGKVALAPQVPGRSAATRSIEDAAQCLQLSAWPLPKVALCLPARRGQEQLTLLGKRNRTMCRGPVPDVPVIRAQHVG